MTAAHPKTFGETERPAPRPADVIMNPKRLAAMQPSRLSGTRAFMLKAIRERWDISIAHFDVDDVGSGRAIYNVKTPHEQFSFIAFSRPPSGKARTGRIIGQSWDMMGALNAGPATEQDIAAAEREIPKLYTGRATPNTLVWCRSNRSMRVFEAALLALVNGEQPAVDDISRVCYLMRNTGLDGNGTFGTRSFPSLGESRALGGPLEAQLLNAYLMREFSCDLIDRIAKQRSPKAASLSPEIRRYLGVGNGSALGLIFFIHRHPRLLNSWIMARETAIAEARALELGQGDPRLLQLIALVEKTIRFRHEDRMVYESFAASDTIAQELQFVAEKLKALRSTGLVSGATRRYPLDVLAQEFEQALLPETYETYLSLLIELVPNVADALAAELGGSDELLVKPAKTVQSLRAQIETEYRWALDIDMSKPGAYAYVWYKSETAEEPRRGLRSEAADAHDLGLDLPGGIQKLHRDALSELDDLSVARFLLKYPQHRHLVARIQSLEGLPYHSPHGNINADDFVPLDLVRLMNVMVHGIDKTRDFLNRNLRGVLFHGAPTPDDIRAGRGDDWFYPALWSA